MAKDNAAKNQAPSAPGNETPKAKFVAPEGFTRYTGDVLGFHDPETDGPIQGIPRGAKLSDSQIDATKPSAFVIFELTKGCSYTEGSGDEQTTAMGQKGDMVGVWMKGGMRGIRNLCGVETIMVHTGEKRLKGRPAAQSPMKTYDFHVKKGSVPKPIPIIEDNRDKSATVKTFLDPKVKAASREPGDDTEDSGEFGF